LGSGSHEGVHPEPIREHLVEMLATVYPPKQVLATVSGWDRTSFTTMEAQRVLRGCPEFRGTLVAAP